MSNLRPSPLYNPEFEHDACGVGFIARITGERSHDVLARALAALKALAHRGAIDADAITGDGAGVLTQLPYEIFRAYFEKEKKTAPADKDLGVGMIFLPRNNELTQAHARKIVIEAVKEEGMAFVGWREVPVDISILGRKAAESVPVVAQALVARLDDISDADYEKKLHLAQKVAEKIAAGH